MQKGNQALRIGIILAIGASILLACDRLPIYSHYEHTPIAGWEKNDVLKYEISPVKEAGYYADGAFGKAYINEAVQAVDASGNVVGYAINCSSMEGYDGEIALSVGFDTEGTVIGISFTTLTETAGMGMLVDTDDWKAQFANVKVDSFTLNKAGGSTADNEIDSVSGASTTSGAVVNAVNAAIDFYNNYLIAG